MGMKSSISAVPSALFRCCDLRLLRAQDLYGIWENIGSEWVGTGGNDSAAPMRDSPETIPELSPQQLQLVQQHFDRVRGLSQLSCLSHSHAPSSDATRLHDECAQEPVCFLQEADSLHPKDKQTLQPSQGVQSPLRLCLCLKFVPQRMLDANCT